MIDTIIFDMGGTIEDISHNALTENLVCDKIIQTLEDVGQIFPVSRNEFWATLMKNRSDYKEMAKNTGLELKPDAIWCDYYLKGLPFDAKSVADISEDLAGMWEVTYFNRKLRPNVQKLLEELKTRKYKLGVISNTISLYSVFDVLESYGIRGYFQDITLSSVLGLRKPRSEIFEVSLRQLQSKAETCMYVGDTISRDVIGSKQHGFAAAVQIKSFLTESSDTELNGNELKPDFIIQDMLEIVDIVDMLNKKQ